MAAQSGGEMVRLRVWDPWVRLVHWSVALLLPFSWWTAETSRYDLHFQSGYAILTLVLFRLAWGVVGSETALRAVREGAEGGARASRPSASSAGSGGGRAQRGRCRHGADPAGIATDASSERVVRRRPDLHARPLARRVDEAWSTLATSVHLRASWVILGCAVLHVLAVAAYRVVARRKLVKPMLTGAMEAPAGTPAPRMGSNLLALALLAASAGFVWWISTLKPASIF